MLFTGLAELTIDAKQRLAIPAKYRSQIDESRDGRAWICVPWPEGSLLRLYTEAEFARISSAEIAGRETLIPSPEQAELEAAFFSLSERIEPDSAGRLTLPRLHLELVSMPQDVVMLGVRNRLEVRGRDAWKQNFKEDTFLKMPTLAARFLHGRGSNATNP